MVGENKILTVSYGTFSCTLEGFDDPFTAMKAIAEYFRDLAAGDRYFGAEPPQPDPEMLQQIAQNTIQAQVSAQTQDDQVILRQGAASTEQPLSPSVSEISPATPPMTAETASATQRHPAQNMLVEPDPVSPPTPVAPIAAAGLAGAGLGAGTSVAEKLQRIRAVVAREAAHEATFSEDQHSDHNAYGRTADQVPQETEDDDPAPHSEVTSTPAVDYPDRPADAAAASSVSAPSTAPAQGVSDAITEDAAPEPDPAREPLIAESETRVHEDPASEPDDLSDEDPAELHDGLDSIADQSAADEFLDDTNSAKQIWDGVQSDTALNEETADSDVTAETAEDTPTEETSAADPNAMSPTELQFDERADTEVADEPQAFAPEEERANSSQNLDATSSDDLATSQELRSPVSDTDIAATEAGTLDDDTAKENVIAPVFDPTSSTQDRSLEERDEQLSVGSEADLDSEPDTAAEDKPQPQAEPQHNISGRDPEDHAPLDDPMSALAAAMPFVSAVPETLHLSTTPSNEALEDIDIASDSGAELSLPPLESDLPKGFAEFEELVETDIQSLEHSERVDVGAPATDGKEGSETPLGSPALEAARTIDEGATSEIFSGAREHVHVQATEGAPSQADPVEDQQLVSEELKLRPGTDIPADEIALPFIAEGAADELAVPAEGYSAEPGLESFDADGGEPDPGGYPTDEAVSQHLETQHSEQSERQDEIAPEMSSKATASTLEPVNLVPKPERPARQRRKIIVQKISRADLQAAKRRTESSETPITPIETPSTKPIVDGSLSEEQEEALLKELRSIDELSDVVTPNAQPIETERSLDPENMSSPEQEAQAAIESGPTAVETPQIAEQRADGLVADHAEDPDTFAPTDTSEKPILPDPSTTTQNDDLDLSDAVSHSGLDRRELLPEETSVDPASSGTPTVEGSADTADNDKTTRDIRELIGDAAAIASDEANSDEQEESDEGPRASRRARREALVQAEEDALERLMSTTNSRLEDNEGSVRRASIAHLKAAVAATKADTSIAEEAAAMDARERDQYRQDLARVVRPGAQPGETNSDRKKRPAPLVLVSPLRTSRRRPDSHERSSELSQDGAVRPRRVVASQPDAQSFRPDSTKHPSFGEGSASEQLVSFSDYAEDANALELPDLLEAAAAYYTFVEKIEHFTRPMLMRKIASVSRGDRFSREAGLRSFGTLLREGKILKSEDGKFIIAEGSRFSSESRYAGE